MRASILVLFLVGTSIGLISCNSNKDSKEKEDLEIKSKLPVIALIDKSEFDFGSVNEGAIVEHRFAFRNEGSLPLVISNVTASCGCTTPEWPRDPINPKSEGSILVKFNTKGKPGPQVKTISVYANTDPSVLELKLSGQVKAVEGTSSK